MQEIDELSRRLEESKDIEGLQFEIANLIAKSLSQSRDSLGYWEKASYADAIAALTRNAEDILAQGEANQFRRHRRPAPGLFRSPVLRPTG